MNNRELHKFVAENPQPVDARSALAHTLRFFADEADSKLVVMATSNVYGDGVKTGLTWGDLRAIALQLDID
jgi:hypothetical protein